MTLSANSDSRLRPTVIARLDLMRSMLLNLTSV
ncbi:MAG: hypothetical protein JWN85_4498 [Gammaproteobacteria bacterium]|nr:hypothetical protein [Gammaproteobacteria bacterium]